MPVPSMTVTVRPISRKMRSQMGPASSVMMSAALAWFISDSTMSSTLDVMKYVSNEYIARSKPKSRPAML